MDTKTNTQKKTNYKQNRRRRLGNKSQPQMKKIFHLKREREKQKTVIYE